LGVVWGVYTVHSRVWEEGRFGAWRVLGRAAAWADQVQRGLVSL
jgi:hypothetical protein